jgi:dethiobiotin synthetase/adenosylmethionine--8-amino-7-oxononanoate aminotransferase
VRNRVPVVYGSRPQEVRSSPSLGTLLTDLLSGVHSPGLHPPLTQADALRPLRLPTLLVAAPQLGGISTTISSYESLLLRGYTVDGVLCLKDPYYRNEDFLEPYFREKGIGFWTFEKPHEKSAKSVAEDGKLLDAYYEVLDRGNGGETSMRDVARVLEEHHGQRIRELETMPRRTLDQVWWPFTQHGLVSRVRLGI